MKESTRVLLALGAGLAGGAVIAATGNASLMRAADLVAPIGTVWVNAIRMTVIPLVIALLITGVASAADLRTIGRIGRRALLAFGGLLIFVAAVIMPIAPLAFRLLPTTGRPPLPAGASEAASQLATAGPAPTVGAWLTSLIPTNPIGAAASGAGVPLIVFTLLFALAIAQSPDRTRTTLVGFFQAVADAMLVLVRWVVLLAPIGVFALVLPLAAHGGLGLAGAVGFYVLVYAAASLVMSLLLYPVVALVGGVSLGRFARAALPAQLIGLSSSSSLASLPAMVEAAEGGLGLSQRVTGFVLPLAVSVFKVAAPVSWTIGALFVAWFYGIDLHLQQLGIIAVASVFLAFAAPGVPRGAFLMLAPLFLAVGLPVEGIGILIAVDALPDIFATVLNVTGDLAAVAIVGRAERGTAEAGAGQRGMVEPPERAA
jgi:Na+/H+-dicarboxylate symporter